MHPVSILCSSWVVPIWFPVRFGVVGLTLFCIPAAFDFWQVLKLENFCYSLFVEPYETYPAHGFESLVGFDILTQPLPTLALRGGYVMMGI